MARRSQSCECESSPFVAGSDNQPSAIVSREHAVVVAEKTSPYVVHRVCKHKRGRVRRGTNLRGRLVAGVESEGNTDVDQTTPLLLSIYPCHYHSRDTKR
jgi:hypothetical protein